jgi:hypothetical protein
VFWSQTTYNIMIRASSTSDAQFLVGKSVLLSGNFAEAGIYDF